MLIRVALLDAGPLITILLTNRVYPTDQTGNARRETVCIGKACVRCAGTTKIHACRQAFNDAVAKVLVNHSLLLAFNVRSQHPPFADA